jgi:hypothetical protein
VTPYQKKALVEKKRAGLRANGHEGVRLGAAHSLLELGVKLQESVKMERRLLALEKSLAVAGKGPA